MNYRKIASRGHLFTFDELEGFQTNVYLIEGSHHLFVLDTFLGPEAMASLIDVMRTLPGEKPVIVFNSHFHWDHIWGNAAFGDVLIFSHQKCRELIIAHGLAELKEYGHLKMGEVILTNPGVTFDSALRFEEDNLFFFHSPGHTEDSSSVWDPLDKVLFVGDNLESPLPYLSTPDLGPYLDTLEKYLTFPAEWIIAGHATSQDRQLLESNRNYVRCFREGKTELYESEPYRRIHEANCQLVNRKE
jgi:cyclase